MGVSKVVFGDQNLIDLTADTVTAEKLAEGKTAHGADGEPITGTAVFGLSEPLDPETVYRETRPTSWQKMPEAQTDEVYILWLMETQKDAISFSVLRGAEGEPMPELYVDCMQYDIFGSLHTVKTITISGDEEIFDLEGYFSDFCGVNGQVILRLRSENIRSFVVSQPVAFSGNDAIKSDIVEIDFNCPNCSVLGFSNMINLRYANITASSYSFTDDVAEMTDSLFFCDRNLLCVRNFNTSAEDACVDEAFYECSSLRCIPNGSYKEAQSLIGIFKYCRSLQNADFQSDNALYLSEAFYYCSALDHLKVRAPSCTTTTRLAAECSALKSLEISAPLVTGAANICRACYSLEEAELYFPESTDCSSAFTSCYNLKTADVTISASGTVLNSAFYNCYSLETVRITGRITGAGSSIFRACRRLTAVTLDDFQGTSPSYLFVNASSVERLSITVTSEYVAFVTTSFQGCENLRRFRLSVSPNGTWPGSNISLRNTKLDRAALRDLAYQLPIIAESKTLTLAGVYGAADLTDEEWALFTEKNWTVVR